MLSKRERVDGALRAAAVDRPPVAAWRHFIPEERAAAPLAQAHIRFFEEFDWDWLKINPRATYYAEAWGSRFDFDDYSGVLPRQLSTAVATPDDLHAITPRRGTEGVFAEQLDLLRQVKDGIGSAHALQTVFSPPCAPCARRLRRARQARPRVASARADRRCTPDRARA